jgi:D-lactate dehydrogenase
MNVLRHAPVAVSEFDSAALLDTLRGVVGRRHLLTGDAPTRRFRSGFRFGSGPVLAVARPGSLVEQWRVLTACVAADVIVIMQAANTGLTGGSTPDGADYDRPVVIINTLRMRHVQLLDEGRQVLCLPGATLDQLEQLLAPLGREPHSVIGSSCLGASVLGGICNNSGGSLIHRGPAYTEMALFARIDAGGQLELVNHLGIALGEDPEIALARLDRGDYRASDVTPGGCASDHDYATHVRDVDADTPARFNADARRLHEAAGSAGHLAVFAVRLDTFPKHDRTAVFYIGTNDADALTRIRRDILSGFQSLPVAGEYLHRDAFDIGDHYGKDTFLTIQKLGTRRLPAFFAAKSRVDAFLERLGVFPRHFSDRALQWLSERFPDHLPKRMRDYRQRYEHHLLLKMSGAGIDEAAAYLETFFANASGDYFACTPDEGAKAFLLRFAVAGAAVRYRAVHPGEVEDIVALDIALRRNDRDWFERLPAELDAPVLHKLYYGHFFCHVMHQDYIVKPGTDCHALEEAMLEVLDARGARYPAEHNVGHLYHAPESQVDFFRQLDPHNGFNPGVGKTSKLRDWA